MFMSVPTCLIFAKMLILSHCAPKLGPELFDPLTFEIDNDPPIQEHKPIPMTSATKILIQRSNTSEETAETPRKPCSHYDYDPKNCKIVNKRILCGYNKNLGKIKNNEEFINLNNDCRLRGDRVECGYSNAPFKGIRRPPAIRQSQDIANNTERVNMTTEKLKTEEIESTSSFKTSKATTDIYVTSTTTQITSSSPTPEQTTTEDINNTNKTNNNKESETIQETTESLTTANITQVATEAITIIIVTESSTAASSSTTTKKISTSTHPVTMCVEKNDHIVCYDKPFDRKKDERKSRRFLRKHKKHFIRI